MKFSVRCIATSLLSVALCNPIPPPEPGRLCTVTIVETLGLSPPAATPLSTVTVTEYSSTVTDYSAIDCSGCVAVEKATLIADYTYTSSQDPAVEHVTAASPTTTTITHCLPSLGIGYASYEAPVTEAQPIGPIRRDTPVPTVGQVSSLDVETECTRYVFPLPTLVWGPTSTLYTETSTVTESVDCGGCGSIVTSYGILGVPPVVRFNTTVTGTKPAIETAFVCRSSVQTSSTSTTSSTIKPSATVDYYAPPPPTAYTEFPKGNTLPTCTISQVVGPYIPKDGTRTIWTATETMTSKVDCGACALVWETGVVNFLVEVVFTASTTAAEPTTRQVLACIE